MHGKQLLQSWESVRTKQNQIQQYQNQLFKICKKSFVTATRSSVGCNDMPEIKGDYDQLRWLLIHSKHQEGASKFKTSFQNQVQQGITYSDEDTGLVDEGTVDDKVSKDAADNLGHFEKRQFLSK